MAKLLLTLLLRPVAQPLRTARSPTTPCSSLSAALASNPIFLIRAVEPTPTKDTALGVLTRATISAIACDIRAPVLMVTARLPATALSGECLTPDQTSRGGSVGS